MYNEDVGLSGFSKNGGGGLSFIVKTAKDNSYITFKTGEFFKKELLNPLKVDDGGTVGIMNRKYLHDKLEQWINANTI